MADRGIQLKRYRIRNANHWHLRGFRLRIEVFDHTDNVDPAVFVYRRHPPDPATGQSQDEWVAVASVVDLSEYPAGEPDPAGATPFFRRTWVEVDVRSESDYKAIWDTVKAEIDNLLHALDRFEDLEEAESVWIGTPRESDSESTSS